MTNKSDNEKEASFGDIILKLIRHTPLPSQPNIFEPTVPYSKEFERKVNELNAKRTAREEAQDKSQRESLRYAKQSRYIAIAAVVVSVVLNVILHYIH